MSNLRLTIELVANKKLSIGGRRSNITSDIEFTKINTTPFIPGTTLKGILRSCMVRISGLLFNGVNQNIIDDMLGASHNNTSSKVKVSNATCEDYKSIILHHITIDDEYGIVKENALFSREYLTKDSRFKFTINATDLSDNEFRLLFLALVEFNYQRIGRSGLVDLKIIKEESTIPEEVRNDKIASKILEVLCK